MTVKEEHRLRVFENRVRRIIFGRKKDGVMGNLRKVHNEEFYNSISSSNMIRKNKSRRMRWAGHVARMRVKRTSHRISVGDH
jgi:hypothetical protein